MGTEPYHDKQTLQEAYNRLGTQKAVADKFSCNKSTISEWMRKNDIETNSQTEPYHDKQTLKEAYDRLGTQKAVANEFSCHRAIVLKWMKKHGLSASTDQRDRVETECANCNSTLELQQCRLDNSNQNFCDYNCKSEWQESAYTGKNNPSWKDPVEMDCEWCEKTFQFKNKYKDARRFCSRSCANNWKSFAWHGDNHHNWIDQSSHLYYGPNWESTREKIHSRDTVCRVCGHDGSDIRLEVHHIVPLRTFEDLENANATDNLILLCSSCHGHVEHGNIPCPVPE